MVVQPNLFLYSKLMENKLKTLHVPHPHVGLAYNLKSCNLQAWDYAGVLCQVAVLVTAPPQGGGGQGG